MSDQVPSESGAALDFSRVVVTGLPSGSGIVTINGNNLPAQTIAPGTGINVTQGPPGTTTITVDTSIYPPNPIVSINADTTVDQIIAAGTGISIAQGPPGTTTITNTGAGGIPSIQGEDGSGGLTPVLTGAILLTAGTDSSPFPTPGFNVVNPAGNELRVRIDPFGTGNAGVVKDPGAALAGDYLRADNTFAPIPGTTVSFPIFVATLAAGTAVVNGVLTPLATFTIGAGAGGTYWIAFAAGVNGIALQFLDVGIRVNGASAPAGGFSGIPESAGQTTDLSGSGNFATLAPGDVVDVFVEHHGGGADTTATASQVFGLRIGP